MLMIQYCTSKNINDLGQKLNADLAVVSKWFIGNLLTLHSSKCKFIVFGSPQKLINVSNTSLQVDGKQLERTESFKYLGVTVQQSMSWTDHDDIMSKKVNQRIGVIKRIKYLLPIEARQTIYNSLIIPLFDYGDILWGKKNNETLMNQLQTLQNKAAKVLLDQTPQSSATEAFSTLDWKPLSSRRSFHPLTTMHKCMHAGIDFDFSLMKNLKNSS